jgi:hypothetical protein
MKPKHYAAAEAVGISKQELGNMRMARARRTGASAGQAAGVATGKMVTDAAVGAVKDISRMASAVVEAGGTSRRRTPQPGEEFMDVLVAFYGRK